MLKTSGTTMKVFRCLKIPLTSMRVDCFESCKKIVLRFQASSISPPPSPASGLVPKSPKRNSSGVSAEQFYYSFYYNEGLENKLSRTPLLGLAKSIYYFLTFNNHENNMSEVLIEINSLSIPNVLNLMLVDY